MKVFAAVLVLAVVISVSSGAEQQKQQQPQQQHQPQQQEHKYTTKFDNVDLDQIIKSDRLMMNYVNCLLEKGKCSPDGAELKKVLPDALKSDCAKCSEKQKEGSRKIIHHLIKHKRNWWEQLEQKYDPERTYVKKYEAELKKEGIKV